MSSELRVLKPGYAIILQTDDGENEFMRATGSCCLVRGPGQTKILFDTMGPWDRDLLIQLLADVKIHPEDINYVVCSHSHADHIGNLNLFTSAMKHFVGTLVYKGDVYDLNCFKPTGSYKYKSSTVENEIDVTCHDGYQLATGIYIEPSPGHTLECISLILENCDSLGRVGLAGDLFENEQDLEDETVWISAGSQNPDLQRASRSRVFNKVDYIVPGHGPMFKVLGERNF